MKPEEIIERFKDKSILVIGDLMLDEFVWGEVNRISPEAPVPVVVVKKQTNTPGGAANVVANLSTLGASVFTSGVIGEDKSGEDLLNLLSNYKVDTSGVFKDITRCTTTKTRIIAQAQQVCRIDRESTNPISEDLSLAIFNYVQSICSKIDGVIISDYAKGTINSFLLSKLVPFLHSHNIAIFVDPKVNHYDLYHKVDVITPNQQEASILTGIKINSEESLFYAGKKILEDLQCSIVLITRGEEGMALFEKNKPSILIPTKAKEVYDVTGAGDTVVAVYTLSYTVCKDSYISAILANYAAGVVVGKVGTATVNPKELLECIDTYER